MTRRDWSQARAKAEQEGCRAHPYGGCVGPLETAHTAARRFDLPGGQAGTLYVDPDDVVGLCRAAHEAFDRHELDLLPFLSYHEAARVVEHLGLEGARRRLAPSVYRAERALRDAAALAADLGGAA